MAIDGDGTVYVGDMLDFFAIDTDGLGNALISYGKDRPFPGVFVGDLALSWVDIVVARQTGGSKV